MGFFMNALPQPMISEITNLLETIFRKYFISEHMQENIHKVIHTWAYEIFRLPFLANLANSSAELCSFGNPYYLILDLCLPASCNNDDLDKIFKLLPYSCGFMDIRDLDRESVPGTYITLTVMCLCFALGITASIYDYYILPYHKHLPYTKSKSRILLLHN